MTARAETHEFQAETQQLLQLVVHSIYSNKDVFLRELISNAADALDKLRLASFANKDLQVDTSDLHVEIAIDPEQRTLTVRDNGIGMSRAEVVDLIGTIAKSGTAELLAKVRDSQDSAAELIGQFGVGFYSSFMVADRVGLTTRRAGEDEATRWESDGSGTYTVETVPDAAQGTSVTLWLKPEEADDNLFDYTSEHKIRELVRRYSDFITWPIRMEVERADDEGETRRETDTLNSMKALWARPRDEISDEEYAEFYQHISRDRREPLEVVAVQAEGTFEYKALLFIPSHAPGDLFAEDHRQGVQLYVKRVFVMDECEALVPPYLRFIKGVVDAQDLSLNISREILQQDRQINLMRRRLTKKVLSTVKTMMSENPERYATVWREFGAVLKEGILSDPDNRDTIVEIASFASTRDPEKPTTLREYVERMGEGQRDIYYMTGASRSVIESSPHIEAFRAKGYEVLLLTDPVDEVWVDVVPEFDGTPLRSIAKGELDLDADGDEDAEPEQRHEEFAELLSWMSDLLADQVKEVRLSSRLTTSPACLVSGAHEMTPTMEKLYRAMGQELPSTKRVLELNPGHPLVEGLRKARGDRGEAAELAETVELLHGTALLAEGGDLTDPARFTRLLADHLAREL
ncbi:molecular chaperone HtpG [Saccharopolyspora dendranthemae]|uniref:Chaperone protein HtpG n=1 Tax=Saccharopolyspora dendranthemae TaxID=1181886 RepID=A0A561U3G1_9PSEU|nr:molecular chaperone HtpG [Saccharopolyspora dendranthemae]TWF93893.1 molecular chaperone HtpG [Saccharopolyspora dendranthemae]